MDFAALNTTAASGSTAAAAAVAKTKNEAGSEDRFLKLLVAQMQNQDPLNPMDNAQITSQMAQINTVAGIEKLNGTVVGLNGQMLQLRALQGASLVGREVTVPGDHLTMSDGVGEAGYELAAAADRVKLEVRNGAGRVVDTVELGALGAGTHAIEWKPPAGLDAGAAYRFRIVATNRAAAVQSTPLMRDRVEAVSAGGDTLSLELARAGTLPYASVKAFN